MKQWARKNLKCIDYNDAVNIFKPGDKWISGTNKTSSDLLLRGVCSGYYRVGGEILEANVLEIPKGFIKRGAFTCHSFQGQTIESGKIFISIRDLFEFTMLYTAVSRARYFYQLVFVL